MVPFTNARRRRAARHEHHRRREEYKRRVALGEPPLRAVERVYAPEHERTLVLIEGGAQAEPKRRAIWVYGSGIRN